MSNLLFFRPKKDRLVGKGMKKEKAFKVSICLNSVLEVHHWLMETFFGSYLLNYLSLSWMYLLIAAPAGDDLCF